MHGFDEGVIGLVWFLQQHVGDDLVDDVLRVMIKVLLLADLTFSWGQTDAEH